MQVIATNDGNRAKSRAIFDIIFLNLFKLSFSDSFTDT